MAIDGTATMWGARARSDRPKAIMFPHDGTSVMPTPSSARLPSATMATATPSRAIDTMAGSTLGSTSRHRMRRWPAPRTSAAFTNSRSDHAIVEARAMRPMSGTVTMARAATSTPDLRPFDTSSWALAKMATSDRASTRAGIDSNTLNTVVSTASAAPRK